MRKNSAALSLPLFRALSLSFKLSIGFATVTEAIFDLGLFYHRFRVLAAAKGFLESGIEVPHGEGFFPEEFETKIDGAQIEVYAKTLKQNDPDKYKVIFSKYLKNKVDPLKIKQNFSSTLKKIQSGA